MKTIISAPLKGKFTYLVKSTDESKKVVSKYKKQYFDESLSLQIIYRDGYTSAHSDETVHSFRRIPSTCSDDNHPVILK